MSDTLRIGNQGESAATDYLREQGFWVVERNWRSGHHEIDIIATKDGALHFIEVKTRKQESLTTPQEAMTKAKINNLVKAINNYVALHSIESEVWLDLITVEVLPNGAMLVDYIPDIASNLRW